MYQSDNGEFATIRARIAETINKIPENDSALMNSITGDKGVDDELLFIRLI